MFPGICGVLCLCLVSSVHCLSYLRFVIPFQVLRCNQWIYKDLVWLSSQTCSSAPHTFIVCDHKAKLYLYLHFNLKTIIITYKLMLWVGLDDKGSANITTKGSKGIFLVKTKKEAFLSSRGLLLSITILSFYPSFFVHFLFSLFSPHWSNNTELSQTLINN